MSTKVRNSGHKSSKSDRSSKSHTASQTKTSFLFVVNEVEANEDPGNAGVPPRFVDGYWKPPNNARGLRSPVVGDIYRWKDGEVTWTGDYSWSNEIQRDANNDYYAHGTIVSVNPYAYQPRYYRGSTVFYCNDHDRFHAACDDVSTRNIETSDDPVYYGWHPLTFGYDRNISYIVQAGERETAVVRNASWIGQVVPTSYRSHSSNQESGGLSGYLSLVVALIAFSCIDRETLSYVLLQSQSWRSRSWRGHNYPHGRIERRGMFVSVYTDPENQEGSTKERLSALENERNPIFTR